MSEITKLELKYRVRRLEEIVGNKEEIKALISLVKSNSIPKLIMFNGPPGSGKTTTAYILARTLLCKDRIGLNPCFKCNACLSIEEQLYKYGRPVTEHGLYLFDMGLKSDLEYVQNIANNINTGTFAGKKKVMIIDELQMVNMQNQDPLLKATEYIPEGVTVIITTSEPYKISKPLRNRVDWTITFNPPTKQELVNYGKTICEEEVISFNKKDLAIIADYTKNNVRQFIKVLDVAKKDKKEVLNLINAETSIRNEQYIKFFEIVQQDMFSFIEFIDSLENIEEFTNGLKYFIKDYIKMMFSAKGVSREYRSKVLNLMSCYNTSTIFDVINILVTPTDRTLNGYELQLLRVAYRLNASYKLESKFEDKLYQDEAEEVVELEASELMPTNFVGSETIDIGQIILEDE